MERRSKQRERERKGGSTLAAIFIKFLLWLLLLQPQQLRHDVDELFMAGSLEGVPRSHSSSSSGSLGSFSLSCMQHNISPIIIIIMMLVLIMILLMHLRNLRSSLCVCVSLNRLRSCLRVPPICLATFNDLFMDAQGFLFNR